MQRICLISDRNTYMKRLCWLLTENGYTVALICRHQKGFDKDQFPKKMKFYQLSSTSFLIKTKEILSIINEFQPDIVHTHFLVRDCVIPLLKIGKKYAYFLSIWGSDINLYSSKSLRFSLPFGR